MDVVTIKPLVDMLLNYGVQLVLLAGVLWILFRYIPKWIDGSIEASKSIPTALNEVNETLKTGIRLMEEVRSDSSQAKEDLDKIKDALGHMAGAAEKGILGAPKEIKDKIPSDVIIEIRKMKDATHNHKHKLDK